ncbi:MAG: DsbC family protein [Proteobacteria bacterium]|nr:MAG: DsbC family protein [Pseudomonadota bacterium]
MMKKILLGLLASTLLVACNNDSAKVSPDKIKADLVKQVPGLTQVDQVNPTKINGLYEVVVGRKIFYVSTDGKYAMFGNLVDLGTKQSVTEQRMQELAKVDFSKLPLDLAVKQVVGDGSRKIAVFTDPDCPYCKMFEKQVVPQLNNVTVYSFMFPLPIHPDAATHAKQIWCSKDRAATWAAWMQKDTPLPTDTSCDTSGLDQIMKVGTELVQVDGTPTIIFENGQIAPGMLPAEQLNAKLDEVSGKAPAASAPVASAAK